MLLYSKREEDDNAQVSCRYPDDLPYMLVGAYGGFALSIGWDEG